VCDCFNVSVFEDVRKNEFLEPQMQDIALDVFFVFAFKVVDVEAQVLVTLFELSKIVEFRT
jgi:hypothetical protein